MTLTGIENKVDELISDLDELTWIPQETITELRNKLDDISDILCDAEAEYGDEPFEDDGLEDDE